MEHFVVSALKYRPKAFEEVIGQEAITRTLENAIRSNQHHKYFLASNSRFVDRRSALEVAASGIDALAAQRRACGACRCHLVRIRFGTTGIPIERRIGAILDSRRCSRCFRDFDCEGCA